MSYVYIRSEPGLWTVGFYRPDDEWEPESDHDSTEEAAQRVAWLNGCNPMTAIGGDFPCCTDSPWWLSPGPGGELSGPYTEAEARDRWLAGRAAWPEQGVWRGPDPRHVQPAHPSWAQPVTLAVITEWGVRYSTEGWVQSYGDGEGGEAVARSAAGDSVNPNGLGALVRRSVTYGPWEEAPSSPWLHDPTDSDIASRNP